MKAVLKLRRGVGEMALEDVEAPRVMPDHVKIATRAVGVCGTDVHIWYDKFPTVPPLVIGHEFAGEIVEIGSGVCNWKCGDRVVVENTYGACGVCELCRTGNGHICSEKRAYGSASNGAMAEYSVFPAHALHRLPDNVSYEQAAVVEPLAVVNRGVVERGGIQPESNVVVFGAGPIGLLAVQVCRAAGANRVVLVGTDKDTKVRLPLGLRFGADAIVNIQQDDLDSIVLSCFGTCEADLVIEASGSPDAVQRAIHLTGRRKVFSVIGLTGEMVAIDWDLAVIKEIDIRFSKSSTYCSWHRAISMIAGGRVDVDTLITHRFGFNQWRDALKVVESGEAVKALVIP